MTKETQSQIIQKACLANGISTHIDWIKGKNDAHSFAQKLALLFRGKETMPIKNSFMYCESLDMCFFFDTSEKPCVSYSGFSTLANPDLAENKLIAAFAKAKEILETMQELADKEEKTGEK